MVDKRWIHVFYKDFYQVPIQLLIDRTEQTKEKYCN